MSFIGTAGELLVNGAESALFSPIKGLWSDGETLWRDARSEFESAFKVFTTLIVHLFEFILATILFVGVLLLAFL